MAERSFRHPPDWPPHPTPAPTQDRYDDPWRHRRTTSPYTRPAEYTRYPQPGAYPGPPPDAAPPPPAAAPPQASSENGSRSRHATGEWRTISDRLAPRDQTRPRTRREDANPWHWLLWVPIVIPLLPMLYNRIEPTFLGIPFFYWSQLSFAFLASAVIAFVHMKAR